MSQDETKQIKRYEKDGRRFVVIDGNEIYVLLYDVIKDMSETGKIIKKAANGLVPTSK